MFKWVMLGGVAAAALIVGGSYFSAASSGNRMEQNIVAQYEQDQNVLSRLSLSVVEAAQVPGMARDDIIAVSKAAMEGRYGDGGSKAVVQAIKEAYPGNIDPKLYTRVQDMIESGRTDFSVEQTKLINKVQIYKTALGSPWTGFWLGVAQYPKIDLADYKVVKSDYSNKSFQSGVDSGIKLK